MLPLVDSRMHDGSRHFGDLPQAVDWYAMREHVYRLHGAALAGFTCDDVTETWIDFTYRGHTFTVNDQFGDYWFFVADSACPDAVLEEVLGHFRKVCC